MSLKARIQTARQKLERARGQAEGLEEMISDLNTELLENRQRSEDGVRAREVLIHVAKATQGRLELQLTDLVSMCMSTVFPGNSKFRVNFEQRRNTLEADLFIVEQGELLNPLDSSGGGLLDMAAIGLRIALWSLAPGRPVFILDEPLKNLSPNKHEASSKLLKDLCDKLGIQIIMVSHSEDIVSYADKVFHIRDGELVKE